MKKLIILLSLILAWLTSNAQDYPQKEVDLSNIAENLFSNLDQDVNYSDLYENMVQLLANPIDINKATPDELRFLNILTEKQIANLVQHRIENRALLSVYELQSIQGFDLQTIYRLIPFIKIADPSLTIDMSFIKRVFTENNNYLVSRYERDLEKRKGFSNTDNGDRKYPGSQDKLYLRFRTSKPGDFSFGFTAEKDAGEQIKWQPGNNQYGFDYVSFHAQLQNKGRIKNLIIGDFQNQFGQGLILGGSFAMGKGSETIATTRRSNLGSLPYTSINESGALRGITLTTQIKRNIYLTTFYSSTKRDGTISNTVDGNKFVSSFSTTGLHRTDTELANRKSVNENNYGVVLNYKNQRLDVGVILNNIDFSLPIIKTQTAYNQFAFSGNQHKAIGAFLNYSFQNFLLFGEVAKNMNAGKGIVIGMIGSLAPNIDISMLFRKYDKNFYTFSSSAFSENSTPQNETGFYWGWKYRYSKQVLLSGYIDLFKFPWLRYRSYAPSQGHEWLGKISYQPSKQFLLYAQIREEQKTRNVPLDTILYKTSNGTKRNLWLSAEYGISKHFKMKSRVQYSNYHLIGKTSGIAVIQDVMFDLNKFSFTARYALFDTDDYDNRQYVYENDVWLAYSLPAYYGKGIRNMLMVEYKLNRKITFWLRYTRSRFNDQSEIGSGLDAISGSVASDVKFQARYKF